MPRRPVVHLLIAAFVGITACSSDDQADTTAATIIETTTTARPDDGVLVIGTVLPTGGSAAELGTSMADALTVALDEINGRGGIGGRRVRLIAREEGDNPATAGLAVQELVQLGVDAIIGPTSSTNALGTLRTAVAAGVLTCSPTASALALDDYPDEGLFFRTIPSDTVQARAIASAVEASGSRTAVVVYLDDAYGRPFAQATQAAINSRGTNVSAPIGFLPSEDSMAEAVQAVLAAAPDVVAVIGDATTGPAMINAIDAADQSTGRDAVSFVVNDAIRRPSSSAQPFSASLARRIVGVAPMPYTNSIQFGDALLAVNPEASGLYAHNAYDCLTIIALAAQAANSSRPREIASSVAAVTASGRSCSTYTTCSTALAEGRNINYNGPSGNLSIDASGNVATVDFERFTFDQSGRDVSDGTIPVGNG